MAAAIWNLHDWVLFDELAKRLLQAHGGEQTAAVLLERDEPNAYALTRLDLQTAFDSGAISKLLLRYIDHDGKLHEILLFPEEQQQVGITVVWMPVFPDMIAAIEFTGISEKLAELFADLDVAKHIGRPPPPVRIYLWRRDVEQQRWWWWSKPLPTEPTIVEPRPAPVDSPKADPAAASGPLAPKEWIAAEVDHWKQTTDYPRRISAAARALEPKMAAAFQAGTCTGHLGWRTIKNKLRDLDPGYALWPRTKDA